MKLEQSFEVQGPLEEVWDALLDIDRIAPCLPGADITGHDDEGNYTGSFKIKLGPTTANYRGTPRIGEVDEAARRATLHARGTSAATTPSTATGGSAEANRPRPQA